MEISLSILIGWGLISALVFCIGVIIGYNAGENDTEKKIVREYKLKRRKKDLYGNKIK